VSLGYGPLEAIARAVAEALGFGLVESALFAAGVYVFIRCSRPSATTRHVLWWIVLCAAAALPVVSIGASLRHIEHRRAVVAQAAVFEHRQDPAAPVRPAARARRSGPAMTIRGPVAPVQFVVDRLHARAIIQYAATAALAVWILGCAWALTALAQGLGSLRRIKRAAAPLDESVLRRLRRWRQSTRLGRPVELGVSNDIDVPVAVGYRTPTILLPGRVVELEAIADIDQIAMHEYAHLNRYDDWTNLAQRVLEHLFWFNPVVAVVGRQIALEREIACDDWVIARTGRAHRYATCLWKLVEASRLPARPIVAPGALLTPHQITVRIEQLLDSRRNAVPRLAPLGTIALGALATALVVGEALRAPAIAIVDPAPAATAALAAPRPTSPSVAALKATVSSPAQREPRPPLVPHPPAKPRAVSQTDVEASGADDDAANVDPGRGVERLAEVVAASAPSASVDRARLEHCLGCDLEGADLRNVDLHDIHLFGARLAGADLRGADLRGATIAGSDFHDVRLDGADLRDASFTGSDLRGTSLAGARLDGTHIVGTSIRGTNVAGTHLRSLIDGCNGCDLRGLDLRAQDLHGIRLAGADLRQADLRGADLSGAHLQAVDLRGANMTNVNLDRAELLDCDVDSSERTAIPETYAWPRAT
jgi:uncharacterized protein YjbI with pentapeptide repeats/beta-lactamase regulating signal transducer with metallopeptidase domain